MRSESTNVLIADNFSGGGGSRTPVFQVVGGTSPSAAGRQVSDRHRPPAVCVDPSPAVMSHQITGRVLMVSRSKWRSGSGRVAGPGGTSLLISKQRVRGCPRQVFCVPALLRRSDDVGSLLPPRSSKSKPRTPLSIVVSMRRDNEVSVRPGRGFHSPERSRRWLVPDRVPPPPCAWS